jgi:hypothetical protein
MKLMTTAVAALATCVAAGAAAGAASETGTRVHPFALHRAVALPESKGWSLRVNRVVPNATAIVRAASPLSKPPAAGRQFVLINVTMRYSGRGRSTVFESGELNAHATPPRVYSFRDGCGAVPNALDDFTKIAAGDAVTGNVCFSVRRRDVRSLLLEWEPLFSATDRQLFFALR